MNTIKKKAVLTLFVIAAAATHCFAQSEDPPLGACDLGDADTPCPLDTWVIVLVLAALAFTAMHLYRKQKSLQA